MKKIIYVFVFIMLTIHVPAIALCAPTIEENQETTEKLMPYIDRQVQRLLQGKFKELAQPGTTLLLAKFVKNFYDALIKEGFTKEEALQIVTSYGFPIIN